MEFGFSLKMIRYRWLGAIFPRSSLHRLRGAAVVKALEKV
jgi:hypothetical protein